MLIFSCNYGQNVSVWQKLLESDISYFRIMLIHRTTRHSLEDMAQRACLPKNGVNLPTFPHVPSFGHISVILRATSMQFSATLGWDGLLSMCTHLTWTPSFREARVIPYDQVEYQCSLLKHKFPIYFVQFFWKLLWKYFSVVINYKEVYHSFQNHVILQNYSE